MNDSQKEFYDCFGLDDFFKNQLATITKNEPNLRLGKVINEERNLYRIQMSMNETRSGIVTGKWAYTAQNRIDYPAVGDWVLVDDQSGKVVIKHMLKRKTSLVRKQVGVVSDVQVLATNVDNVFITTSLNGDLNKGRLERYLTFAWDSGARPIIVLTKSDLCDDIESCVFDLERSYPGIDIITLTQNDYDVQALTRFVSEGTSTVLVGSSGVGKSTLINFLIGENVMHVQDIRSDDDKGRHTTTSRSLHLSRFGGMVIDTPGMRELQFANHEEGFHHQYADIEEMILNCRYTNCTHVSEKDCAILEALDCGFLDQARWKSFKKIQGEIRHAQRRMDKVLLSQDRKAWKKRTLEARQRIKGSP